jgi:hypothetical protein
MRDGQRTRHWGSTISGNFALCRGCCGCIGLVYTEVTSDGPFRTANAFSSLIEFCSHVEIVNLRLAPVDGIKDN